MSFFALRMGHDSLSAYVVREAGLTQRIAARGHERLFHKKISIQYDIEINC